MSELVRALALAGFFRQRIRRCDGPTFKAHSYISRQYADMVDAAVHQTLRYFTRGMLGLLLDFPELADEVFDFVCHSVPGRYRNSDAYAIALRPTAA